MPQSGKDKNVIFKDVILLYIDGNRDAQNDKYAMGCQVTWNDLYVPVWAGVVGNIEQLGKVTNIRHLDTVLLGDLEFYNKIDLEVVKNTVPAFCGTPALAACKRSLRCRRDAAIRALLRCLAAAMRSLLRAVGVLFRATEALIELLFFIIGAAVLPGVAPSATPASAPDSRAPCARNAETAAALPLWIAASSGVRPVKSFSFMSTPP